MLSSVLRSERAVQVNIIIMRTFVRLREILATHKELARKLEELETKYDAQFRVVFDAIRQLMAPPTAAEKRRIGFPVRPEVQNERGPYRKAGDTMATIYKRRDLRPIPEGAEIVTYRGRTIREVDERQDGHDATGPVERRGRQDRLRIALLHGAVFRPRRPAGESGNAVRRQGRGPAVGERTGSPGDEAAGRTDRPDARTVRDRSPADARGTRCRLPGLPDRQGQHGETMFNRRAGMSNG